MFYARSREAWRAWLEKNHERVNKISLIRYKNHTGTPSLSHREAMEEAICFGWIDTTIKKIDDEKYMIRFVRRTPKSRWSNNTLAYAKRLLREGKMSPVGLKFYRQGKKKPVIDFHTRNPEMPDDLKNALENYNCLEDFNRFAPSYKRVYFIWIERAKRKETREKRILAVVRRALAREKPGTLKE